MREFKGAPFPREDTNYIILYKLYYPRWTYQFISSFPSGKLLSSFSPDRSVFVSIAGSHTVQMMRPPTSSLRFSGGLGEPEPSNNFFENRHKMNVIGILGLKFEFSKKVLASTTKVMDPHFDDIQARKKGLGSIFAPLKRTRMTDHLRLKS